MHAKAALYQILSICGILCGVTGLHPRHVGLEERESFFQITGSKGDVSMGGARPDRLEIRNLQKNAEAFDLYIQSLDWFQRLDQSKLLSYYQIGGIHGRPYIAWDGVNGPNQAGYCTHSSILFPPWHRPYLALFEQILWGYAQKLAADYPAGSTRARYQAAAEKLRAPYWDWANNATLPDVVSSPTIQVNTKSGPKTMRNPLAAYAFHPKPDGVVFPPDEMVSQYPQTVRFPDENGNSQPDLVNELLNSNAGLLQDRTYLLLSRETSYAAFSNTNGNRSAGQFDSLEAIHNEIHGIVGSGGHMAYVAYAAFDPIFWLHHTNIDRLYAIWQAINPDSYVTDQIAPSNTFTTLQGSIEGINSELTPFHGANGIGLTSANSRYTKQFGYTYPEVRDWGKSAAQTAKDTRVAIKRLYDPTIGLKPRSPGIGDTTPPLRIPPSLIVDGKYRQWFVNIRVHKFALSGPGFIHIFAGNFSNNPTEWPNDSGLVGTQTIFANKNTTSMDGDEHLVHASIPLMRKLVDMYDKNFISSLDPVSVVPFLVKYLNWRILKVDRTAVDPGHVNTLKIYVGSQDVTVAKSDAEFPTYGAIFSHIEATNGKPGGVNYGEDF